MKYLRSTLLLLSVLCALGGASSAEEASLRIAVFPVQLRGDYLPLDSETVSKLFRETLLAEAPELSYVPLEAPANIDEPAETFKAAEAKGIELIAWGTIRFERATGSTRDPSQQGRLMLLVTATASIEIVNVADQQMVVDDPVMVTSSGQSDSTVEDGDPDLEEQLASESVREVVKSLIEVVRARRAAAKS